MQSGLEPGWVRRDVSRLAAERAQAGRLGTPVSRVQGALRLVLMTCLVDAAFRDDAMGSMRVAAWIDIRGEIDERLGRLNAVELTRCTEALDRVVVLDECTDIDVRLAVIAAQLELGGTTMATTPEAGLCRAAESRLAHAGLPGGVRARLGRTIAGLSGEGAASPTMLVGIAGALDNVAEALEQPLPDGPLVLRQAVVVLDRRLHGRLDLLEAQSTWLRRCADPWTHPEALATLGTLRHLATLRRRMAALSSETHYLGMSEGQRRRVVECAELIRRDEEGADVHGWIMEAAVELPQADVIGEALAAAGWPGTDPMAQFGWRPSGPLGEPTARLHGALRSAQWLRESGDLDGAEAARRSARAAARDILRLSGRN